MRISQEAFEKICIDRGWMPYIRSTIMHIGARRFPLKYEMGLKEVPLFTVMSVDRARLLTDLISQQSTSPVVK